MTPDGKECTRINDKVHLYIPLYDEQHGGNASGICNMDDPAVQLMAGNKQFNKAAVQSMAGHIKLNNPEGGQTAFYDLTVQGFSSFFENPSPIAFYYMNIPDTGVQKDETKGKETVGTEKTEEKNSAGDGKTKKKNSAANKSAGNVESTKARLASGMEVEWRGRKLTFKWGRVAKATGYDVYAAYCGNKTFNRVKTTKDNRITVSKINGKVLNRRKDIKLYVVTKKGKKKLSASSLVHVAGPKSKYTNVRQINLKNKSCIIKKGKSKKIRAKIILKDKKRSSFFQGMYQDSVTCQETKKSQS